VVAAATVDDATRLPLDHIVLTATAYDDAGLLARSA
jgi:hypothetical protein